jgi:alpha-galactosidase
VIDHGPRHLRWEGRDARTRLGLGVLVDLDEAGVLTMRASLTNLGDDVYQLHRATLTVPLPAGADEVLRFVGRWAHEFQSVRTTWQHGTILVENRRGRTSHDNHPTAVVGGAGFGETSGAVLGIHLAWSGNAELRFDRLADGRRLAQVGPVLAPGDVDLSPGETWEMPAVVVAWSPDGLGSLSHSLHRHLRARPHHPRAPRPVMLNTWEAVYFDHDLDTLRRLVDRAAAVGVERFVLDDGWFRARKDDRAGLGDWTVDRTVWPDGLHPLVDHVRGCGLDFGLWVEPEMVNPDSDLYRAHPDWVLMPDGETALLARNQLMLDLVRPEVADYLFAALDALVDEYAIDYLKWDANRDVLDASHAGRAAGHRQVEAVYALMARVRAAHPGLEIEACASGGARADYGVLAHADRIWTSDSNDALDRQRIQHGASLLFPLELMGAHIGPPVNPITGRRHTLGFRGATALFGHLGIEWDLLSATDDDLAALAVVVAAYKTHRGLLHSGRLHRLETDDSTSLATMVVGDDGADALVSVAQLTTPVWSVPARLRLAGLDPDRDYAVCLVSELGDPPGIMRRGPAWLDAGLSATGADLMTVGLTLPVMRPETALVLRISSR